MTRGQGRLEALGSPTIRFHLIEASHDLQVFLEALVGWCQCRDPENLNPETNMGWLIGKKSWRSPVDIVDMV